MGWPSDEREPLLLRSCTWQGGRTERGHDLFFNLCDGAEGQETPDIEVVHTLERHGVAFTGATSGFYEPTRQQMKDACTSVGVATPRGLLARTAEDVERAAEELRFPLFVKHHNSYASVDLSRRSRVRSVAGLRQQARKMMSRHGAALIEELKWQDYGDLECEPVQDPALGQFAFTVVALVFVSHASASSRCTHSRPKSAPTRT
ncbi:MAG: hypothetical protein DRQ55_18050 [Planctomycetota bacterium]|nr:MAG: hypothetical protein DRQ55_18050 [Planctomycetota bacterium]